MTTRSNGEQEFGQQLDTAWEEFETLLSDRIGELEADDQLLLELAGREDLDGAAPYVQIGAWNAREGVALRCEAVSNHFLHARWRLTEEQQQALVDLGFDPPTGGPDSEEAGGSPNFFVDLLHDGVADAVAAMAVGALRDVYGVPHPCLLDADEDLVPPAPAEPTRAPSAPPAELADDDECLTVRSPQELSDALDTVLTPYFGSVPRRDEDGDIPVDTAEGRFWIRISHDVPAVDLFGCVAAGIKDRVRGLELAGELTRLTPLLQFDLRDDADLMTHLRISCAPLHPGQLRGLVHAMSVAFDEACREAERQLRLRPLPPKPATRRRAAAAAVRELVRAEQSEGWDQGSLDAEVVVAVCEADRAMVVELLRSTQRSLSACRRRLREQEVPWERRRLIRQEAALRRERTLLREALLLLARGRVVPPGAPRADQDRRAG